MNELEAQLKLSLLYADLLRDLADLGRFTWTPSERQRAIAMVDEAVDAAVVVKQQAEPWMPSYSTDEAHAQLDEDDD